VNVIKPMPPNFVPTFAVQDKPTMAQFDASNAPVLRASSSSETETAHSRVADHKSTDSPHKEPSHEELLQDLFAQLANASGNEV
jgi:hypothetical protein